MMYHSKLINISDRAMLSYQSLRGFRFGQYFSGHLACLDVNRCPEEIEEGPTHLEHVIGAQPRMINHDIK